jgi:hypothetical protein
MGTCLLREKNIDLSGLLEVGVGMISQPKKLICLETRRKEGQDPHRAVETTTTTMMMMMKEVKFEISSHPERYPSRRSRITRPNCILCNNSPMKRKIVYRV